MEPSTVYGLVMSAIGFAFGVMVCGGTLYHASTKKKEVMTAWRYDEILHPYKKKVDQYLQYDNTADALKVLLEGLCEADKEMMETVEG